MASPLHSSEERRLRAKHIDPESAPTGAVRFVNHFTDAMEDDHMVPVEPKQVRGSPARSAEVPLSLQQEKRHPEHRHQQQQQQPQPHVAPMPPPWQVAAPPTWDRRCLLGRPLADVRLDYAFGAALGEGQSGHIRLCAHRATGQLLACKTVNKLTVKGPAYAELLRSEVAALESLSHHPHVVRLAAVYEDETDVHMILDYCSGGDLFERVKQVKQLSEGDAADVCARLAKVVRSCQRRGLIHRDLKLENILLATSASNTDIRVADFGVATYVKPGEKLTAKNGTPLYMAPEVLDGCYGPECDIWSAGVILYILLCGVPPFWRPDDGGIFAAIQAGRVNTVDGPWRGISRAAKDLVHRMLCSDPSRRITAKEILTHPWILQHTSLRVPMAAEAFQPKAAPSGAFAYGPASAAAPPAADVCDPRREPLDDLVPEMSPAALAYAVERDPWGLGLGCGGECPTGAFSRAAAERRMRWRRSLEMSYSQGEMRT